LYKSTLKKSHNVHAEVLTTTVICDKNYLVVQANDSEADTWHTAKKSCTQVNTIFVYCMIIYEY